jgi:hypothetical protein
MQAADVHFPAAHNALQSSNAATGAPASTVCGKRPVQFVNVYMHARNGQTTTLRAFKKA